MGAAAGQRGDRVIRQRIADEASVLVTVQQRHLNDLCARATRFEDAAKDAKSLAHSAAEDLRRAKALIARLRAENAALKAEKRSVVGVLDACKRHISVAGNPHKKWAVTFVKSQLMKARLL